MWASWAGEGVARYFEDKRKIGFIQPIRMAREVLNDDVNLFLGILRVGNADRGRLAWPTSNSAGGPTIGTS